MFRIFLSIHYIKPFAKIDKFKISRRFYINNYSKIKYNNVIIYFKTIIFIKTLKK